MLVGDDGLAMRYDTYDHSITYVNGTFTVLGHALTSVVWRPGGDFAYVASSATGDVWKFAEHTGFELLEDWDEPCYGRFLPPKLQRVCRGHRGRRFRHHR